MAELVLETDPRLLVLDQRRLEPLQVASIGVACARHGPTVPAQQRRTPWISFGRRLGMRPKRHANQHDEPDSHARDMMCRPRHFAAYPLSKRFLHPSAPRMIYLSD